MVAVNRASSSSVDVPMALMKKKRPSLVTRLGKIAAMCALLMLGSRVVKDKKKRLLIMVAIAASSWLNSLKAKKFPKHLLPNKSFSWYPWIGHAHTYLKLRREPHSAILRVSRQNGFKSCFISFPQGMSVFVCHEEKDRRYVLKQNWLNYQKNYDDQYGFKHCFNELLGKGIFNVDGPAWSTHRKIAANLFTGNNMANIMSRVFVRHADLLKTELKKFAARREPFDVQMLLQALIFDAFCEIAFGVSPESFQKSVRGEKDPFLVAFDSCQSIASLRFWDPPHLRRLRRYFRLGEEAHFKEHVEVVEGYVNKIVEERMARRDSETCDGSGFTDILGLYISHARAKGREAEIINHVYLRDMIVNFMIAGRDTTSFALTNMLSLLAENPDVEGPFVREIESKLAHGAEAFVRSEVGNFPLGDAVFFEALRMFPSVADDVRFCMEDDVLPSGIQVDSGTMVVIANHSIGRNPKYFDDPDTFRPSRWLSVQGGKQVCLRPDEYRFPFFWAGNRVCLGKDMARLESKILVSILLKDLKFSMAKPRDESYVQGPVMFYTNGMHLYCEERSEN